jgi:hypothetical protein
VKPGEAGSKGDPAWYEVDEATLRWAVTALVCCAAVQGLTVGLLVVLIAVLH